MAAVLSAGLIASVDIDTFWAHIQGFRHLMAESDAALTFDESRRSPSPRMASRLASRLAP